MDWREVTIYTTTEGIGPVEALLEDNGVEGYVLEDAADFEEFLKDTEIYWDYVDEDLVREKRAQETCLKIYLPDSDEGAKQYADIRAELETLKARDEEHAWGRLCTASSSAIMHSWVVSWLPVPKDAAGSISRIRRPCGSSTVSHEGLIIKLRPTGNGLKYCFQPHSQSS